MIKNKFIRILGHLLIYSSLLSAGTITAAGARSSIYGINPFPSTTDWKNILYNISDKFSGATPTTVWIVGTISDSGICEMEFPSSTSYKNITFSKNDRHEAYLSYFDSLGIKVYLQVEPGMADPKDCMAAVLNHYGSHSCIAGFGIDIEWYPSTGNTNSYTAASKSSIQEWSTYLKTFNSSYQLFVKHWDSSMLGGSPVDDVLYIDDSQGVNNMTDIVDEFSVWADDFYPNDVGFQVGYSADNSWWSNLTDPVADLGNEIKNNITNGQNIAYFWVDFTIDDASLDLYANNLTPIIQTNSDFDKSEINILQSANQINIKFNPNSIIKSGYYEILSISGKTLLESNINQDVSNISINKNIFANGTYILHLSYNGKSVQKRFLNIK